MTLFTKFSLTLALVSGGAFSQDLKPLSISNLMSAEAVTTQLSKSVVEPLEPVKWRRTYQISVLALGAATAADIASSFKFSHDGQREANSFLTSHNGRYGAKGAAIEGGIAAASLLLQRTLVKRHPGLRVPLAIANFGIAGFQVFNVRHNLNY